MKTKTKISILTAACILSLPSLSDRLNPIQLDLAKRILEDKSTPFKSKDDAKKVLYYYKHEHPHHSSKEVKTINDEKNKQIEYSYISVKKKPAPAKRKIVVSKKELPITQKIQIQKEQIKPAAMNKKKTEPAEIKKGQGIYKDTAAQNIIKNLIPDGWTLELDEVQVKLSRTRLNYYTEKPNMESIGEIVTALGLKMKVFNRLKVVIITK